MKRRFATSIAFLLFAFSAGAPAQDIDVSASVANPVLRGYYKTIAAHFNVELRFVVGIKRQDVRDHQIPVVLLIASRSKADAASLIEARKKGLDWMDIARLHKLDASVFHFPVENPTGIVFQKPLAKFDSVPREKWSEIVLTDEEIINLVNLRMLCERTKADPQAVMKMRTAGSHYIEIHAALTATPPPNPAP
jgi:hypothetical protein